MKDFSGSGLAVMGFKQGLLVARVSPEVPCLLRVYFAGVPENGTRSDPKGAKITVLAHD